MGYFISTLSPEDELEVEIYFENTSFGCQRSPHWGSSGSTGELASIDKRREKVGRKSSTAPLESNVEDVLFHRGRWFGGGRGEEEEEEEEEDSMVGVSVVGRLAM